jgi:hypothetical protein
MNSKSYVYQIVYGSHMLTDPRYSIGVLYLHSVASMDSLILNP